jgi:hypothetical protein
MKKFISHSMVAFNGIVASLVCSANKFLQIGYRHIWNIRKGGGSKKLSILDLHSHAKTSIIKVGQSNWYFQKWQTSRVGKGAKTNCKTRISNPNPNPKQDRKWTLIMSSSASFKPGH